MEVNPYEALRDYVGAYATQTAAAKQLKITPQYLSDLLAEKRAVSEKILKRLGLKRAVVSVNE